MQNGTKEKQLKLIWLLIKKNRGQNNIPSIKNTNYNNTKNISSNKNRNLPPISNKNENLQNPQKTNNNITEINITDELLKNNTPYRTQDFKHYTNIVKNMQNNFYLLGNL